MTDAEGQRWRDLAEKQQLAFEALMGNDGSRIHVELGVRGAPREVEPAMEELRRLVRAAGFPYK